MPLDEGSSVEQVVILRSHLEEWETALRWAYGHFAALDLSEHYRQGRPNLNQPSKLANLTARAYNRIEGYLNDGELVQPE